MRPDIAAALARVCNYRCGDCGWEARGLWRDHDAHHYGHWHK